ncbi:MAG TPA: UDP-N-acetylmuramoyl-tripeptide--D-alanyl-D-alanine ligase [Aquabacterium sp.]|nr:UDP-N-acetylmuramoyl-tripeptide--D-alanyl-D-alanine ligase [Aquabacterium sp.]
MSMMTLSEAASAMGSRLTGQDGSFESVSTDSRSIGPGQLFIALRGATYDAARFAADTLAKGAAGVVLNQDSAPQLSPSIVVDDTRIALGRLAAHWRQKFSIPVVAITGSNGKTTVKEMLSAILCAGAGDGASVLVTEGNMNNDIGCPLTLLRLRSSHRCAVLEMGMNHFGELAYLTHLAKPTVALVNNAQLAHVGLLGSVEAIARAKGEIFEGLSSDGVAVINADDPHAALWRSMNASRRIIDFGFGVGAQVRGKSVGDDNGQTLHIHVPRGELAVRMQLAGEHNARNALAATACALAINTNLKAVEQGLAGFAGVKGRLQNKPGLNGALFIDDTYNANPDSVKAAITVLGMHPGKKILVVGDMGELGDQSAVLHAQVGLAARQAGLDRLLALGDWSRSAVQSFGAGARHYERIQELLADLENELAPDVTVLVKGSRAMEMERVVDSFTGEH